MRRLLTLLALAAALYYAYDYMVVRGGMDALRPPKPMPLAAPPGGELRRDPGRGLNPFVAETEHAAPPQQPRVPKIPSGGSQPPG